MHAIVNSSMQEYTLSIVIPARNEEKVLQRNLDAIHRASTQAAITPEVVIVLNRCSDGTEAIALRNGCKIINEDAKNLSIIRNAGIAAATGSLIITIDADSVMSQNMLTDIVKTMQSRRFIGGGVIFYPERISPGIALTFLCLLPYVLWHRIAGGLFFFEKDAWQAIGGFNPAWRSAEDIDFALRLKEHGKLNKLSFKILKSSWIITSTRKFDIFGDWYYLRNFRELLRLLRGRDSEAADRLWYDVER